MLPPLLITHLFIMAENNMLVEAEGTDHLPILGVDLNTVFGKAIDAAILLEGIPADCLDATIDESRMDFGTFKAEAFLGIVADEAFNVLNAQTNPDFQRRILTGEMMEAANNRGGAITTAATNRMNRILTHLNEPRVSAKAGIEAFRQFAIKLTAAIDALPKGAQTREVVKTPTFQTPAAAAPSVRQIAGQFAAGLETASFVNGSDVLVTRDESKPGMLRRRVVAAGEGNAVRGTSKPLFED